MATDYDAPRRNEADDVTEESLEAIAGRPRNDAATAVLDVDDGDVVDSFDLPGADLSGEEFSVLELLPRAAPQPAGHSARRSDALLGLRVDVEGPAGDSTAPRRG